MRLLFGTPVHADGRQGGRDRSTILPVSAIWAMNDRLQIVSPTSPLFAKRVRSPRTVEARRPPRRAPIQARRYVSLAERRWLMRRGVFVCVLLALCAIFAAPAAAQSEQDRWMLNAQVGPSFGTFGTTPTFDATGGYKFNERLAVIGEFGGLWHAPLRKRQRSLRR